MRARAFIIHLERAAARLTQVEWLLSNLPLAVEVLPAVDGATLSTGEKETVFCPRLHRPNYPFGMSDAEIGCFLSHRRAWREIVRQNLDFGFIIEDDVMLDSDAFSRAWALAHPHVSEAGYIRLPWREREVARRTVAQDWDGRLFQPRRVGLGMLAQLVTSQAAERLLAATEQFDRPVDTFMQMHWITGVRPWSVYPNGIDEISARLGGSTIGKKRGLGDRLRRELLRPVYRCRIAIRSTFVQEANFQRS